MREQEAALLQVTRDAVEQRKAAEEKRKKDALPEFEITERQSVPQLALHPSGTWVFLSVADRPDAKSTIVPNYVTESGYTEDIPSRSKVGDSQGRQRLAILDLKTRKHVWADGAFAGTAKAQGKDEPRELRWSAPMVSPDGRLVVTTARSDDFKDRWIVALDPESGRARVIDALHDDAWIREAGGGPSGAGGMGWMPDGRSLWFLSERDGFMHLYVVDAAQPGAAPVQLTSGRFELASATLSHDRTKFYLVSNEAHPGERHMYEMPVAGGPRTKLTTMTGSNIGEVSPDGALIALIHSSATRPPEVFVMPNRAGAPTQQVTTTPTDEWRAFRWIDPEVVTFKARDGADVYARLYTPEMIGGAARPRQAGGRLRPRRRLPAERAQVLVHLLPRVHVPQPARLAGLRRARRRLPRERRLRPRLAHGHLPPHGRHRTSTTSSTARSTSSRRSGSTRSGSASTAAATAGSSR